jgi:hypothetical protein
MPYTSRQPSWARALNAYEAQGDEDMANLRGGSAISPEEAYGFEADGSSTGVPGRIHGTTRQGDMAAMRAWRNRSSVGPTLTSAGIDSRINARQVANRNARYSMWDNIMRQQRGMGGAGIAPAPSVGGISRGVARSGVARPAGVASGVNLARSTVMPPTGMASAGTSPTAPPMPSAPIGQPPPKHMIDGIPAATWIQRKGGTVPLSS